jgi:hypothetical protein
VAYTKNPQGHQKPYPVSCRLSKEDFNKFDELTKRPGKKQQIIESLILDFVKKRYIEDKSLLQHIHAKGKIHDYDFNTIERRELRDLEKKGLVEIKPTNEHEKDFFWELTNKGAEVLLK